MRRSVEDVLAQVEFSSIERSESSRACAAARTVRHRGPCVLRHARAGVQRQLLLRPAHTASTARTS